MRGPNNFHPSSAKLLFLNVSTFLLLSIEGLNTEEACGRGYIHGTVQGRAKTQGIETIGYHAERVLSRVLALAGVKSKPSSVGSQILLHSLLTGAPLHLRHGKQPDMIHILPDIEPLA